MLIYLDSMIVQYCADYEDFVFGEITGTTAKCPVREPKLRRELQALRQLIFLEQLGDWDYACTPVLLEELSAGQPTAEQRTVYALLAETWRDSDWREAFPTDREMVAVIEHFMRRLNLRGSADRRHLAEAVALNASWFLTNDKEIIDKCRDKDLPLRVARPSECVDQISVGFFLR